MVMNKSIRGLIIEIIVMIIIIISTFMIYSDERIINERNELLAFGNSSLELNLVSEARDRTIRRLNNDEIYDNYDCDVIQVKNNTEYKTKYHLILKMEKINTVDNYLVMVNSKIYNLSDLKYKEDNDYYYFIIEDFIIYNKDQNITIALFLNDNDIDYYESFNYSYMIEVIR